MNFKVGRKAIQTDANNAAHANKHTSDWLLQIHNMSAVYLDNCPLLN